MERCESGGVNADGPTYFGLLGISGRTWAAYNRFGFPSNAYYATLGQQIIVGEAIEGSYVPDQNGTCAGW